MDAPKYQNEAGPHPDDENEPEMPEIEAKTGESLKDVLGRTGVVAKAARRIWQALDATNANGWPDYNNRLKAACEVRNTVDGKPTEYTQTTIEVKTPLIDREKLLDNPATVAAIARAAGKDGAEKLIEALQRTITERQAKGQVVDA